MKEMKDIRQANLQVLSNRYGSQRAIAEKLHKTPGYINQLLTGHRSISEKTARKIEALLVLPNTWMDQDNVGNELTGEGGKSAEPNSNINLSSLMAVATPRTHAALEAIEQAYQKGTLTDEDLQLLETIAKRIAHD